MRKDEMVAKINEMNEWLELVAEAKKNADAIEMELKAEMEDREVSELTVGNYILRYTEYTQQRFATSEFKKTYLELYKAFQKTITGRRFTVSC